MDYYLNIGANLGDRNASIEHAIATLRKLGTVRAVSLAMESEPWGFASPHRFLNVAVWLQSQLTPQAMLQAIKAIERSMGSTQHRTAQGGYADRTIDIDIVAAGELTISTPTLQIPHPRLPEREFYLRPMAQIAPLWHHPITGKTCLQMLAELQANSKA